MRVVICVLLFDQDSGWLQGRRPIIILAIDCGSVHLRSLQGLLDIVRVAEFAVEGAALSRSIST